MCRSKEVKKIHARVTFVEGEVLEMKNQFATLCGKWDGVLLALKGLYVPVIIGVVLELCRIFFLKG